MKLKNWLYDSNFLEVVELPCPVISVGNLRMGGTGKTPLIQALLESFSNLDGVVLVSKNYRAQVQEISMVDLTHPNPGAYFGDEPTLLAKKFPSLKVFVGPKKSETASYAYKFLRPRLIIVDDGFQHRRLRRDLDIVIIDPMDFWARLFPFGPLRETIFDAHRAKYIVVNPIEDSDELDRIQKELALLVLAKKNPDLQSKIKFKWVGAKGQLQLENPTAEFLKAPKIGAFAGIARPERFFSNLEKSLGRKLDTIWKFQDHVHYDFQILEPLEAWIRANPNSILFTTEKDQVKLQEWISHHPEVKIAPWKLKLIHGEDLIHDVGRLLEKNR